MKHALFRLTESENKTKKVESVMKKQQIFGIAALALGIAAVAKLNKSATAIIITAILLIKTISFQYSRI